MKRIIGLITAGVLVCSTLAFAGGDKNKNRHDGDKGKGNPKQERINK
jgi:hypothetical protein